MYPHMLLYDECRLKVPYERKFLVVNDTHLPGCYGLVPQVWHRIHPLVAKITEEIIRGKKGLDKTLLVSIQS